MSSGPSVSWLHPAFSGASRFERRHQIVEHRRIGVFLDRQRRRGVADEQRHRAFARAGLLHEFRDLGGEIGKAAPGV
jgi:hypothetical protein